MAGGKGRWGGGERGRKDKGASKGRGKVASGGTCLCMGTGVTMGAFLNQGALSDEGVLMDEGVKTMVTTEVLLEDEQGRYAGVVTATFSISVCHSEEE